MTKAVKRATKRKRAKNTDSVTLGYVLLDSIVEQWNAQPNPPKVYVRGYRIHHGLVGVVSVTLGCIGLIASALSKDEKTQAAIANISGLAIGGGLRLIEDDIADMNDWFNFEKNNSASQPALLQKYALPSQIYPLSGISERQPPGFV